MDAKHTPGPWHSEKGSATYLISTESNLVIGEVYGKAILPAREHKANALLIAAAPDLLEACKAMVEAFQYHNPGGTTKPQGATLAAARAAINKATNVTPT